MLRLCVCAVWKTRRSLSAALGLTLLRPKSCNPQCAVLEASRLPDLLYWLWLPAMFPELNNLLGFRVESPPVDTVMLVKESNADGSFVLHHLISLYLKGGCNVCLVGFAQSLTHYANVANRLSVNLTKMKQEGKFLFIDALNLLGSELISNFENPSSCDSKLINFSSSKAHSSLKGLFFKIKESLEGMADWDSRSTLVVLDDLSILVSLGTPVLDVVYFTEYLKKIVHSKQGSLACLCQSSQEDDTKELLCKQLCYMSSIVFHVSGLETGYCRDVHGELTVEMRDPSLDSNLNREKKVQFKLSDKNVTLFALGMSAAAIGHWVRWLF